MATRTLLADPELFLEASWVDGRALRAADGATLAVTNPATGEALGRVPALQVGDGRDAGVEQGPLIAAAALGKVKAHVADALGQGAKLLCGGRRHARGGNFYEPTVLAEAKPSMRCAREETFGPVAPLFRFRDEAEAVRLANDTEFGLAAYLYTRDLGRAWRVAEGLEVGMLGSTC
jgi:succinate-semialdehyde dehydrogenase/glutarate-semialdehyde dehydrogenase